MMDPELVRAKVDAARAHEEATSVRERAYQELAELDRVLRHDPVRADPPDGAADPPEGREVPWWRKLLP